MAVIAAAEAEPWVELVEGGVRVVELLAAALAAPSAVAKLSVGAVALLPWTEAEEGEASTTPSLTGRLEAELILPFFALVS